MGDSEQRNPAETMQNAVLKHFRIVANALRATMGDPYFLQALEHLRREAQEKMQQQLAMAGLPVNLATITHPVLDRQPMIDAARAEFLANQLERIADLSGQGAAAGPAIAAAALKSRVHPDTLAIVPPDGHASSPADTTH